MHDVCNYELKVRRDICVMATTPPPPPLPSPPRPLNTLFHSVRKKYRNNKPTYTRRNKIRHTLQFQKILHQVLELNYYSRWEYCISSDSPSHCLLHLTHTQQCHYP